MRVLSVAYPLFPVNADSAGGAEQVLFHLEAELVRAGQKSTVIAAQGSSVCGQLIPTRPLMPEANEEDRATAQSEHREAIESALLSEEFDLVHYHGLDVASYYVQSHLPAVITVHLPVSWYAPEALTLPGATIVFVSHSQAHGLEGEVVSNGIDVDSFAGQDLPREHHLCLARICPEKGIHLALQAAHIANEPLVIAGPVHPFPTHQKYFSDEIAPHLDKRRTYAGQVSLPEKIKLLNSAKSLLIPSLAAETSSLVAMEAAAAGTPSIAFRSGALPEVIEHGITGYIIDDIAEMAATMGNCKNISSKECRRIAVNRFRRQGMAADYLALYRKLVSARP